MKNLIKFELYNIIRRKELKLVFFLLFSASIIDFILICYTYKGYPIETVRAFYDEFFLISPHALVGKQLYVVLFPIIVSLIYSDSLVIESKNNINNYIYTRTRKSNHILAKVTVNFGVVFLCLFTCLFVNFILTKLTFPDISGSNLYGTPSSILYSLEGLKNLSESSSLYLIDKISVYNKNIYILLIIILKSIAGGLLATLSLALSTILKKNRIISIFSVFILINLMLLIGHLLPQIFSVDKFIDFENNSSILSYTIVSLVVLSASIIIFRKWIQKDSI